MLRRPVALGIVVALILLGASIFPQLVGNTYARHLSILLFTTIALGESWNIVGGYAGQYSIGHAAFFGVGAYTTLGLLENFHVAPWYGAWVAVVLSAIAALVVGAICFRLRGPYFVLASIAMAEIMRLVALEWKPVTNGAEGILLTEIPPFKIGSWVVTDFSNKVPFYYLALALAVATIAVNARVRHSRLGYYLQAIREDQDAASSLGIRLGHNKNLALLISAALTSLAGSFYGLYVGFIDPQTVLGIDVSIQAVLICILGGVGTIVGPVLGAIVLVCLSEALRANLLAQALFSIGLVSPTSAAGAFLKENVAHAHALIYGLLMMLVILFIPDGIASVAKVFWTHGPKPGPLSAAPPAAPTEPKPHAPA